MTKNVDPTIGIYKYIYTRKINLLQVFISYCGFLILKFFEAEDFGFQVNAKKL